MVETDAERETMDSVQNIIMQNQSTVSRAVKEAKLC